MSKPKRMILGLIPNNMCNLKCHYCYISQVPDGERFGKEFEYSISHMVKCLSVERLGGKCLINLTGQGETMLQKNIVDLCRALLDEGHYIEFVTNLTVTKILNELLEIPENLLKHMEFKISFHYKELIEKNLIDIFWENVMKVRNSACSFSLELMPNDEIIENINDIIDMCYEKVGAKCHVTVGRADYLATRGLLTNKTKNEYVNIWNAFESKMFELKMKLLNVKRREFCYAGDWTLFVNMYNGECSPCYAQPYKQNIFLDPEKPIKYCAVGKHCCEPFCINGHAHISLGVIPELDAPTYAEIRNRECSDGTEWLSDDMKEFLGSKLYESNIEYNVINKFTNYCGWYMRSIGSIFRYPDKVIRRMKLRIFQLKNKVNRTKG